MQGKSVVVVTGTASGKTLCYNLPVLDRLLQDPQARALYLFPTRALAQDQRSTLSELLVHIPDSRASLPLAVYDGDTPASARPSIRSKARLVMSNPDMLHTGILPHHTSWADFFHNLQFVDHRRDARLSRRVSARTSLTSSVDCRGSLAIMGQHLSSS